MDLSKCLVTYWEFNNLSILAKLNQKFLLLMKNSPLCDLMILNESE